MSALSDLLAGIDTVGKSIAGSKSTVTTSSQIDPAAAGAFDQLQAQIAGLTSKGATEADINTLLAPLLDHVKQTVLPMVGKQQQAGLYSSTPLTGMALQEGTKAANQALADATKQRDALLQTAMYGAANRANASKSSRAVTQQAGNPLLQMLGIGGAGLGAAQKLGLVGADPLGIGELLAPIKAKVAAGKVAKNMKGIGEEDEAVREALKADGTSGTPIDLEATDASLGSSGSANAEAGLLSSNVEAGGGAADFLYQSAIGDMVGGTEGLAATAAGGAELGTSAFAEAGAEGLGFDFGLGTVAETGAEFGLEELATAAVLKVICTEAVRQGLMDRDLYLTEAAINLGRLSKTTLAGYHKLATPVVLRMRKSPRVAKFFARCAIHYSNQVVGNKNLRGMLIMHLLEPVCWLVGKFCKSVNISVALYGTQGEV